MQSTCYCGIYFLDIFILQFHALIHIFDFCSSKKITQIDSCSSAQTRDKSALNYRKQSIGSEEIFHPPDGCDTTNSKSKRGHFWWKIIICRRDNYTGTGGGMVGDHHQVAEKQPDQARHLLLQVFCIVWQACLMVEAVSISYFWQMESA